MDQTKRSISFNRKLDNRLYNTSISEEIDVLLGTSGSVRAFDSPHDLHEHLAEGALLNVNKLASKALSIPCGDYMVWATDAGHTILFPVKKQTQDVFEGYGEQYEVFTRDLLNHWNTIERVLAEQESEGDPQPDPQQNEFSSEIQMNTVDRTPIVRAMEQHGHTVTSLAKAIDVDPPAVSRILRKPQKGSGDPGGRNPSLPLAAAIAHELKMDAEALFPDIFGVPQQQFKAKQTRRTSKTTSESKISENKKIEYRDYIITHRKKPIPDRNSDYEFCHKYFDGPGDPRCGTAGSVKSAKMAIDDIEDDI